ncbi:MFS transporter [Streptosporangium sp. NPDC002721]|uniref:MFS transporter n=1 Tax=Streptosporangium sp. NPDC002721 TaxID=3366188 RepID=UPI0036CEE68B
MARARTAVGAGLRTAGVAWDDFLIMPATLPFRLARAAAFAAVCLGLSVMAHVLAGGSVSVPTATVALVLAFVAALAVSGRERTLAVILPLLAGVQAGVHVLFSLAHAASPAEMAEMIGHVHSGLLPGLGMLVAHGWAVGLTALWLARGEAVLWALLRRLGARLRRVLVVVVTPAYAPFLTADAIEPGVLRSAALRYVVSRRGPPRIVTVTSG